MTAPQPPAVYWSPSQGWLWPEDDGTVTGVDMGELALYGRDLPGDAVPLVPAATGLPAWTTCPTCSSSRPHLHPTADLCPDRFHRPQPVTADEWRSEVARWADLLDQVRHLPAGTGLDAVHRIVADMRRELAAPALGEDTPDA